MNDLPKLISDYINGPMTVMEGWCHAKTPEALAHAVLDSKPDVVVEIGVFGGRSLIALALACKANAKGIVYGIDPWLPSASVEGFENDRPNADYWARVDHDMIYKKCLACCVQNDVLSQAVLIRARSEQMLPLIRTIDLLHIDGNHSEPHSMHDVTNYVPLVRTSGLICMDDTNWDCTKKAVEILETMCDFQFAIDAPGQQCKFYLKH